jgi:hypothetical protein
LRSKVFERLPPSGARQRARQPPATRSMLAISITFLK